jgi:GntR family transcriptional repressor for pyruvate dehydrogenase complex
MVDRESEIARHFHRVTIKRPADVIIEQISDLIARRIIKAGDRLPPERVLAERFGISRGAVREALRRLEFFRIVKTSPQSGTVVENLGEHILLGLIANIVNSEDTSPDMLIEVRTAIEALSVRLATQRATPRQIDEIRRAQTRMEEQAAAGAFTLEEDLLFHLKIAEATGNNLLRSLIALLGPDVLHFSHLHTTYRDGRVHVAAKEHVGILEAIETGQTDEAERRMVAHLGHSYEQFHIERSAASGRDDDGDDDDAPRPPRATRRKSGDGTARKARVLAVEPDDGDD